MTSKITETACLFFIGNSSIPVEKGTPIFWGNKLGQPLTAEAPHVAEQGTRLVLYQFFKSLNILINHRNAPCWRPPLQLLPRVHLMSFQPVTLTRNLLKYLKLYVISTPLDCYILARKIWKVTHLVKVKHQHGLIYVTWKTVAVVPI